MARPTKYNEKINKKALDYLANYREYGDLIPSAAGLACVLEIGRRTLHDWAVQADKAEFSRILDKIQATQERVLLTNGLSGEFNSAIVKLALGKHGYSEKQQTELTGPDGGPLKAEIATTFVFNPVGSGHGQPDQN